MPQVQRHSLAELTPEQVRSIVSLRVEVWPKEKRLGELIDAFTRGREGTDGQEFFIVWNHDEAIAQAEIFPRTIGTANGDMLVMALAGVCVSPGRQGEGLGRTVVREAFRQVDAGGYPISLFQTGVPDFYRKLGAATVHNEFRDGTNRDAPESSPWWEPHIMIYPGNAVWPAGLIDLNGRGY